METTLEVSDPSQVAEVRRAIASFGDADGLGSDLVARAALVGTELCTNILKYARAGTVSIATHAGTGAGLDGCIDLVAVDRGPGMADVELSLRDGHSTGGSLGLGLGSIRRAASVFDAYSLPGGGTALFVRLEADKRHKTPADDPVVGACMVPIRGERVCGDGWRCWRSGRLLAVSVVDGLGHGPKAAEASALALAAVGAHIWSHGPVQAVQAAHQALLSTRGAVMAVTVIDPAAGTLRFVGVGNISAMVWSGTTMGRLASTDGTVGFSLRTPREVVHPWGLRSVLVLHSDGLGSRWNLSAHPGLLSHHPALAAAVLHRDFGRNTDDATAVVVKHA